MGTQANWQIWKAANPEAWNYFLQFARQAAETGERFSSKMLVERVRWEMRVVRTDATYKINNDWTAFIARDLIAEIPQVEPLLELRRSRADERTSS